MNKFLLLIFLLMCFLLYSFIKKEDKYFNPDGEKIDSRIINELNLKLDKIQAIYSDLQIKQGFLSARGFIAYEKPANFLMSCDSIFGKEIEVGSNSNHFWFYSRNMNPRALYYCEANKIEKTRLKKIFYPNILSELLGINKIKNLELRKKEKIYYTEDEIKIGDKNFKKITLIKNKKIIGYDLCDDYRIILEIRILDFQKIKEIEIPKKITINWIEESIKQEWQLENTKLNYNFSNWDMPKYKNQINLIDY